MKKFLFVLILILTVFSLKAQKDVYILVDLSKSIDPHQLQEAKKVLTQVLNGTAPDNFEFSTGDKNDLLNFQLKQNDKLAINVFGNKDFTWQMQPKLTTIKNDNTTNDIISNINWFPNQDWTYYTLAKALVAREARKTARNYLLCIISDGYDSYPSTQGTPGYNKEQSDLVIKYNSKSEGVNENGASVFKMSDVTKQNKRCDDLFFTFFTNVSIVNFIPPNQIKHIAEGINIISPTRAKKDIPFPIYNENVKLEWDCTSKSKKIIYSVIVNGYDGNNFSYLTDTLTTKTHLLESLLNGKYEIIISAYNASIISDTTYIEVNVFKDNRIKITSPVGTKNNPNKIKGESVNVSWRCPDCDENTTYTVNVVGTDGNKEKVNPVKLKNFSTSFNNLSSGKYRISVSGNTGTSSDTTYIEVSNGGGAGWFFVLILLAAIGFGVYFLLKKMRNKVADNPNNYIGNKQSSNNNNDTSDDGMF